MCFATAATASFVPGALVAVASFRRHHPHFAGDVAVIHDGLPRHLRDCLQAACGEVRYVHVSAALRQRLDALRTAQPRLAHRLGELLCLEAFRLRGYRKVLFYDADVLFRAPVDALFHSPALLLCRPDEAHLRGQGRDPDTFAPVPRTAGAMQRTFGSGFLMLDGRLLADGRHYEALLDLVRPEAWADRATMHTDQFILNRHFAGRQTLVDWRYDYPVPMAAEVRAVTGWSMDDARALHFPGPVKPWMAQAMLRWTEGNAAFKPHRAYRWWADAYRECLTRAHVEAAGSRWREARRTGGRRDARVRQDAHAPEPLDSRVLPASAGMTGNDEAGRRDGRPARRPKAHDVQAGETPALPGSGRPSAPDLRSVAGETPALPGSAADTAPENPPLRRVAAETPASARTRTLPEGTGPRSREDDEGGRR